MKKVVFIVTVKEAEGETNCNYFEIKEIYVFVIITTFERSTLLNIVMRTIE